MADPTRAQDVEPLLQPGQTHAAVTGHLADIVLDPEVGRRARLAIAASMALLLVFVAAVGMLLARGVGIWGVNQPVHWGIAIVNTVWWIGVALAGTIISAGLLVHKPWRNSLNRLAETVTVFAAFCAALFPVLHLGRPWLFYWMAPYASTMAVYPNFRSPLTWDFFGFLSYLTLAVLFWFIGMIPDMAVLRDRARTRATRTAYGLLALGWRGSARHWRRWRRLYLIVAGLAVPHVLAVHAGTAMLFAAAPLPGWHSTILPVYFTSGAVFSGFALVAVVTVLARHVFRLHDVITVPHVDYLGRALLATGLLTLYCWFMEAFSMVYSGETARLDTLLDRIAGTYAWAFWGAFALNFVVLQALWWRRVRIHAAALVVVGVAVTIGMWLERYMILTTALYRGHVPAMWRAYGGTFWDWALTLGTLGLFVFLLLIFLRLVPVVSIAEVKETLHEAKKEARRG